jgi:hypothetical protein
MEFVCEKCDKEFRTKNNLAYHIENEVCVEKLHACKLCCSRFTSKNSMYRHMRTSCKVKKKNEEDRQSIYIKLLEKQSDHTDKLTELLEENKKMQKERNTMLNKIDKLEKTVKKCTKHVKVSNIDKSQKIVNNKCNINYGVQNVVLVGYGKEDISKIDNIDMLQGFKDGFYSTLKLTDVIHFNPKYPEFHNVYISSMKNKYAMMYDGDDWNLIKKNVLIDKIYSKNKNYIEENLDDFYNSLSKSQKNALRRWIDIDDDVDNRIKEIKDSIKMLLYNKRDIPMKTRSENNLSNQKTIERK